MKTVHRATANKLLGAATTAVRRIKEARKLLSAEITANTVRDPDKKSWWPDAEKKPETVTYRTEDIEKILWDLTTTELELRWWSTPPDQRDKLSKPFSLR